MDAVPVIVAAGIGYFLGAFVKDREWRSRMQRSIKRGQEMTQDLRARGESPRGSPGWAEAAVESLRDRSYLEGWVEGLRIAMGLPPLEEK